MSIRASFQKCTFHFDFDARTSRGAMKDRTSWFIKLEAGDLFGLGECAPLPGLSLEKLAQLDETIANTIGRINHSQWSIPQLAGDAFTRLDSIHELLADHFSEVFLLENPSVVFAIETALLDLAAGGKRMIFDNSFVKGEPIPINGLIWMGGLDFMLQQIEIKIRDGYNCLKVKVGGLDFDKDCDILQYIRRKYFRNAIEVRLDANGYFKPDDVDYKLSRLARFDVHSIEQPIKAGSKELAQVIKTSAIPVALDEELIPVTKRDDKARLLDEVNPHFIILKPSLHGGMYGCREWIGLAEERKIGWWMTSALESMVGLNAISQFTANYPISIPQGLGTGQIYNDNVSSPLVVSAGTLRYDPNGTWDLERLQPAGIPD